MGHRLTRISTRTGDDGTTGLADGRRVRKDDARVQALGDVDELNASLGVLLAEALPGDVRAVLARVQHELFDLGGELATPGLSLIDEAAVAALDDDLARHNAALPPLAEFILPAGSRATALAHASRTVARRAERAVVALAALEAVHPGPQRYLNRLSDLLFVLARVLARTPGEGRGEVLWRSARLRSSTSP